MSQAWAAFIFTTKALVAQTTDSETSHAPPTRSSLAILKDVKNAINRLEGFKLVNFTTEIELRVELLP